MGLAQGTAMAKRQAALRRRMGPGTFGYKGQTFDATSRPIRQMQSGGLLPDGGTNADYADPREITLNPGDFTAGGVYTPPKATERCTYQGLPFTILKVPPPELGYGVPIAQALVVYQTPADDDDTFDDPQIAMYPAPPA